MSSLQRYFEPVVRRRKRGDWTAGVLTLAASVGAFVLAPTVDSPSASSRLLVVGVVGLFAPLAVLMLSLKFSRAMSALAEPKRIVWFYGVQRGGSVYEVVVGFDSGKLYRFPLPLISIKKGFCQKGLSLLAREAPHATSVYSDSNLAKFKKDPTSLRK